jgi:F-type H+-transporting ATPase subunit b
MPQLDFATYPTQLFWLLVTFIALYFLMWKIVIPRISGVLEDRQSRRENDLEKAETLRSEAEGVLAAYEKAMADGRSTAQKILLDAASKISQNQALREAESAERLSAKIAEAEERILEARNKAMLDLEPLAAELAQATASKLSGSNISQESATSAVQTTLRDMNP